MNELLLIRLEKAKIKGDKIIKEIYKKQLENVRLKKELNRVNGETKIDTRDILKHYCKDEIGKLEVVLKNKIQLLIDTLKYKEEI